MYRSRFGGKLADHFRFRVVTIEGKRYIVVGTDDAQECVERLEVDQVPHAQIAQRSVYPIAIITEHQVLHTLLNPELAGRTGVSSAIATGPIVLLAHKHPLSGLG